MNRKLEEILTSRFVVKEIVNNLDYLLEIIPELKMTISFDQKQHPNDLDLFWDILSRLSLSPNDYDIRLVILLHDIAKPYYYQTEEVKDYKKYAKMSSIISKNILTRLEYNDSYIEKICKMIEYYDTDLLDIDDLIFLRKILIVQDCDVYSHNLQYLDKRVNCIAKLKKKIGEVNEKKE